MASDSYNGAWSFTTYEDIWMPFAVLGGMTLGLMLFLLIVLKRRDPV